MSKIPDTLFQNIKAGLCVPWCGAGVSVGSGLPTWNQLVNSLIDTCKNNGLDENAESELLALSNNGDFDDVVDYARNFLGEGEYRQFLWQIFGNINNTNEIQEEIVKLPVPAIFTTNYDRLLEKALADHSNKLPVVYTSFDSTTLWRQFATKEFFLLKVHGDITRPDTVIFSSKDYANHIFSNLAFMSFLQRIFVSNSILFIGSSLNDQYIKRIFEETAFVTQGVAMQHFMFSFKMGPIRRRILRDRFNIRVIDLESYHEVVPFLGELNAKL
jgi:hypothetical protein